MRTAIKVGLVVAVAVGLYLLWKRYGPASAVGGAVAVPPAPVGTGAAPTHTSPTGGKTGGALTGALDRRIAIKVRTTK